jgi:DNA (cytosine-5)-methyltransferase 1
MRFLSLFSGIGGLDLGLERAGMTCAAQVEIDPFCRRVLAKHWPNVLRFEDVRTLAREKLTGEVDCIAGGFPCQDVSLAKSCAAGLDGDRSSLWFEFERLIGDIRPRFVIVENVPGLLVRGADRVLGGMATLGYDCEWSIVSACSMGAPHTRERLFILGYSPEVAARRNKGQGTAGRWMQVSGNRPCESGTYWSSEPRVARVAYGIPRGLDRLGAIGNAVCPQVAEFVGKRIVDIDQAGG